VIINYRMKYGAQILILRINLLLSNAQISSVTFVQLVYLKRHDHHRPNSSEQFYVTLYFVVTQFIAFVNAWWS